MERQLSRRAFTLGAGVLGLSAATALPAVATAKPDVWAQRAQDSYAAMQRYLYLGVADNNMYLEAYPKQSGDNAYSFVWSLREATAATIDVNQMPPTHGAYSADIARRFTALSHYWDASRGAYDSYPPAPYGSAGDPYYDDNTVIGLEFVREYQLSRQRDLLDKARQIFDFVITAWDDDPAHQPLGGMHWVDASSNTIKATNVTSLAAELAAHLYEITGEPQYLDWARRSYEWVRTNMQRSAGLYYNSVDFSGTVDKTLWSYNSGSMIGAATLLHRATGNASYLDLALADADGALSYWSENGRYYDQPAVFNAILFANLLLLDSVRHNPTHREVIAQYADLIWSRNRDAATGLFSFQASGGGAPDPTIRPQTVEHSAAIQIFSLLAWRPSDYQYVA